MSITLKAGLRTGAIVVPPSKSHAHRLLIANFLAGAGVPADAEGDSADVIATKRCLRRLGDGGRRAREGTRTTVLDVGESGSTLRFLAPIAAALGFKAEYIRHGRLAERPFKAYDTIGAGEHALPGNISSQFVTGLLFALPLLKGDSWIRFTTPLESRGYVAMTLDVIRKAGIRVEAREDGYCVPGDQRYRPQSSDVEGDWSGAAFWYAMNALGSEIAISGVDDGSAQPDRAIVPYLAELAAPGNAARGGTSSTGSGGGIVLDVRECPDIFPVLTVAAAGFAHLTVFTGIARLRLKECDRVAAMAETLGKLGVSVTVTDDRFEVVGTSGLFKPVDTSFRSFGDHRIAMSVAVAATRSSVPLELDDIACTAKSYPAFPAELDRLGFIPFHNSMLEH